MTAGAETARLWAVQGPDERWGIALATGDPLPGASFATEREAIRRAQAMARSDFGRLLDALLDHGWHPVTVRASALDVAERRPGRGIRRHGRRWGAGSDGPRWVLAASTDSYNVVTGEPSGTHSFLASFLPGDGSLEASSPRSPLGGLVREKSSISDLIGVARTESPPSRAERHNEARVTYQKQARFNHAAAMKQRQSVLDEMAETIEHAPDALSAVEALVAGGFLDYYAQIQALLKDAERRLPG
jgi:hypothetical protein